MIRPLGVDLSLGESVVDEVRAIREMIDAEVEHDLARLADRARQTSQAVRQEFQMRTATVPDYPNA